MQYLLDTSVIIDFLRQKPPVRDFVLSHKDDIIVTSSICEAEIYSGVYREEKKNISKRKQQVKRLFASFYQVLSFDSAQAEIAGQVRAQLAKKGNLIDDLDILISATAISSQSVLVTKNPKHFQRIQNLEILTI